MMNFGTKMEEKDVDEMIKEAKPDTDGNIDYETFVKLILKEPKV